MRAPDAAANSAPTASLSDTLLTTAAPSASIESARALVQERFGIDARVSLLTSERDQNFRLVDADGRGYLLKITNAAENPAVTDFQTMALMHIATTDPALPVPRVVAALDGRPIVDVTLGALRHKARLLTYLPGTPLSASRSSPELVANLARCLAKLGSALHGFRHPAARHDLLWDIQQAGRLRGIVRQIAGMAQRSLVERFLDNFEDNALPVLARLRSQVIHNDFNPHNILLDPRAPEHVSGVIDFGDMVHAPLVDDVAVAAAYLEDADDDGLASAAQFIGAYHEVCALEPDEIDVLFDLIAVRHVMTVAITEWRARRYPANSTYILKNNPRAWAGLRSFGSIPRAVAQARFRHACGME